MEEKFLKDKVILVTGASRGIGAACSEFLLSQGAHVLINYFQNKDDAESIVKNYQKAKAYQADVRNQEEVDELFKYIKTEYGRLDALVNNAGVMLADMISTTNENNINHQIDLNIKAPFYCMRKGARMMMRKQNGSIVNISSIMGRVGASGHTMYAATKGALLSMTLSASKELGPHGIRVNAVAPGIIGTELIKHISEKQRTEICKYIALGRLGTVEDVAKVIGFLCSDWSQYISGQIIGVDGDMTLPPAL
jgi:3-oxoacyl-[acyl-carrier protein] reductase